MMLRRSQQLPQEFNDSCIASCYVRSVSPGFPKLDLLLAPSRCGLRATMLGWLALRLPRLLHHKGRWAPLLMEVSQDLLYSSCFVQVSLCRHELVSQCTHPFVELGRSVLQCLLSPVHLEDGFGHEARCRSKPMQHMALLQHASDVSASPSLASWAGCPATTIPEKTAA